MSTDTGKVYTEPATIEKARKRGEKLVPVSERVARQVLRARTAKAAVLRRRRRAKLQKASRKANR